MTGGFEDTELAEDLVGVTSARLLAAGAPRAERLQALRLLGVLATVADARRQVRRPLAEVAGEFDLPVADVERWLALLVDAGAVRWEDSKLVLAAVEPPAAGGLRLNDFLELVGETEAAAASRPARTRRRQLARPAGALLAAAAVVLLALVAPSVVREGSTPVSTSRDEAPAVSTTSGSRPSASSHPRTGSATPGSTEATTPPPTVDPGGVQVGPVLVPTTTSLALPCPTGNPLVQVLGTTTTADGRLAVDGLAHNNSGEPVVIRAFTLRATIAGRQVTAPGTDHDIVVPRYSTVLWQASLPVIAPAGTLVQAVLGDWAWSSPDVPATCPTP